MTPLKPDHDAAKPAQTPSPGLSHLNERGEALMVDVGAKPQTVRTARAQAIVRMQPATQKAILDGQLPKGDVLATARIAGIMAGQENARPDPPLPPAWHWKKSASTSHHRERIASPSKRWFS